MTATDATDSGPSLSLDRPFPYAAVPDPELDACVDPHWLALRGDSPLPTTYLHPAMAGLRPGWLRWTALVLVAVFVGATTAGVCLTYGPPGHWF